MSKYKAEIKLNGKTHTVEVIAGQRYIDGKTIEEFIKTVDIVTLQELAIVGKQALVDEKRGTKPRKYQKIMDCFHIQKNN